MDRPIVYVDSSVVCRGKLAEARAAYAELTDFVARHEPGLPMYAVYFSEFADRVTVVHAHRDESSLAFHMREAGPRFARFADLLRLQSIDVLGPVGPELLGGLRQNAQMLGGATVTAHDLEAGFLR
jgi:hypothetical protein